MAVATLYKAHSLIRHLQRGWNFFRPERNEGFDILPASQRVSEDMGIAERRTQCTKISISSRGTTPNSSCSWPVTMSIKWITSLCFNSMWTRVKMHHRLLGSAAEEREQLRGHAC